MEVVKRGAAVAKRGAAQQQGQAASHQSSFEPLKLERVFGSGSCAAAAVACPHPVVPGLMAYSCGAVVVLYDSQHKQQTAFFSPKPRRSLMAGKPYACLAFSRDGAFLAAGERSQQGPEILVWEVSSTRCLQALRGHKHGVGSIAFSHDGRLLVSTGESYDGQLCVWDWQAGVMLARQHTQAEVQRACFAEELAAGAAGLTITTVGKAGHFKVWSLTLPTGRGRDGHLPVSGQASLTPRPASLKEYRASHFVAVAAGLADGSSPQAQPLLYALTQAGVLLTLRPATRTIDKSLSLQVPAAFALAVSSGLIACACAAGVVRLFATRTLAFKGNLPRPSAGRSSGGALSEGNGGAAGGSSSGGGGVVAGQAPGAADLQASAGSLFPDAVGCAFDSGGDRLTVVYADRSLMVWDVRVPNKVTRMRSVLSHSGVVWSAALIPPWQAALLGYGNVPATPGYSGGSGGGAKGEVAAFGPSSVLCTCGADGTVRLWNVCINNSASTAGPMGVPADVAGAAKVTRTLRAIIHASQPASPDSAAATGDANRRFAPDAPLPMPGAPGGAGAAGAAAGSGHGGAAKPVALRCLRVSPCGRHLATGDVRGNLRVFDLATLALQMLKEAHDAEILSLDYSPPSLDGTCYLASASRDTLVHVYDMSRGYELVGTCDAHAGAVTAVRFSAQGGRLALLSCSADKSVVFRLVQLGSCGLSFEVYHTERMARGVLYDMAVDPAGGRAVAVGQDNQLRLFDVATGRAIRNFSGDPASGEAVSVILDSSGHLAICSCADGSVVVYDVDAGALLARGSGHADVCTGAALLEDHRGLVTVGGDGCALLWRLTPRLVQRLQDAAAESRRQLEAQAAAQVAMLAQQRQQRLLQRKERENEEPLQPDRQQQHVTPGVRRRKAWDLAGAGNGAATAAGAGGEAEAAGHEVAANEDDEEPRQVEVDMSATMLRIREGKPLLSLEKLPRWAQRTAGLNHESTAGAAASTEGASVANTAPEVAAAAVAPKAPVLAGVWAQRVVMPLPPPEAAALAPAAAAAAAAAEAELPEPFAASAVAAAAVARTGTLADQARAWAEVVEEDDEIVFCDSLEDGQLLGDPRDASVDPELGPAVPEAASGGGAAEAAVVASAAATTGGGVEPQVGEAGKASSEVTLERDTRREGGSPRSPDVAAGRSGVEENASSGCASNRPGELPEEAEAREAAAPGEGDAIRRDLFREHFDSLGLDQGSATKAPPPDPRRLSFTQVYRQARASSVAGSLTDGASTPQRGGTGGGAGAGRGTAGGVGSARGTAGGAAAAAPPLPPLAAELATTPYLSRIPLPAGVNAGRGCGGGATAALIDADGAITGAAWTPERSMLPLTSPALAKTDKQLQELERIRLRLLSTMRKRQSNEEAALGPAAPRPIDDAGAAQDAAQPRQVTEPSAANTGPDAQADASAVVSPKPPQQQPRLAAASDGGAGALEAPAQAPEAHNPAGWTGAAGEREATVRRGGTSGGGFLLPPPPAYTPASPGLRAAGDQLLESPKVAAAPSPGFSSLTAGTPLMGQGGPSPADAVAAAMAAAAGGGDDAASRLFVFNPIYGASPSMTPMGASEMHRASGFLGASPRANGGFVRRIPRSGAGEAGPASSPAESGPASDAVAVVARTTDEVIRAVLESEGGGDVASGGGDVASGGGGTIGGEADVAAPGGGVCVVTMDALGAGGKECSRRATAEEASGAVDAAAAATAMATPGSSPAKGLQQSTRRPVISLVLPAIKPKSEGSPAKTQGSLGGGCSAPQREGAPAQAQAGVAAPGEEDADAMLERMQLALRDAATAYRRLLHTSAAAPASVAVRASIAELSALLECAKAAASPPGTALEPRWATPMPMQIAEPLHEQVRSWLLPETEAAEPPPPPPAVLCISPQVSQELLSRPQPGGSRLGRMRSSAAAEGAALLASGGCMSGGVRSASSSQVVVEVGLGLVESVVEEKLQQRMQEEMRRVEEAVMQRVMQTMMMRQQSPM